MATDHHRPARRQALPIAIGFLVSAWLAVEAVRCSPAEPPGASSVEQTRGDEAVAAAPPPAAEPTRSATPAAEPRDAGAATTIGRLMRATDEHDRSMLAEIERTTHRAPSASALELLELRRAGKPRAQLEAFIQTKLEGGIPARLAAMKWLRATHGEPEPADNNTVLRAPGTPAEQPRIVKPLTKKAP